MHKFIMRNSIFEIRPNVRDQRCSRVGKTQNQIKQNKRKHDESNTQCIAFGECRNLYGMSNNNSLYGNDVI